MLRLSDDEFLSIFLKACSSITVSSAIANQFVISYIGRVGR